MKKYYLPLMLVAALGCGAAEAALPDYAAQILQKEYQTMEGNQLRNSLKKPLANNLQVEGTVTIDKIMVEGNRKLPASYVLKRIHCKEGQSLDVKKLEKELCLFNNTNFSQLQAELIPTNHPGVYGLQLKVVEHKKNAGSLYIDNAGLKSTRGMRIGWYKESYGILHNDDLLSGVKYWSRGAWGGYTTYDTPFSHKGLRARGGLISEHVKAKKGAYDGEYKSTLYDLWGGLRHPLRISDNTSLETFGELHYKWYDTDYFGGTRFADRKQYNGAYGFKLRHFDKGGTTYAKLAGNLYLEKTARGMEGDSSTRGFYWQGELFRMQDLGKKQKLAARVVGLYSNKDTLPATENLSLGGAYSVRGFEEGLLSISKGVYGTVEYSAPITRSGLRGHVFYDYGFGYVENKDDNNSLTSCGVGLSYSQKGWSGKIAVGVPLTHPADEKVASARVHFQMQKNI